MNRSIFLCLWLVAATGVLGAQQASPSGPYQGTANPPADDAIVTTETPQAKPPAGQKSVEPAAASPNETVQPAEAPPRSGASSQADGTDDGIVVVEPQSNGATAGQPALTDRPAGGDPDGDIVHPQPLGPGELGAGTRIRVRLLERLSTASSEKGEIFRSRVASDVLQGGQVLIPAGAEIDGTVVEVSSGHLGGRGSMRLRPETAILADGSRFRLYAEVSGAPGSRTRVGSEGEILPDSRMKRDSLEYGGAVGAGAVTGAIVAGPVGALTGSLIGAGAITAHLLLNHPQATLETGTTLLFTLTERVNLVPARTGGN